MSFPEAAAQTIFFSLNAVVVEMPGIYVEKMSENGAVFKESDSHPYGWGSIC